MELVLGEVEYEKKKVVVEGEVHTAYESYTNITIKGEYPAIHGWKCIANIDHENGQNLVNINVDIDVSIFRDRKPVCDHCGHHKIRVKSYLIQNEDFGEIMQIGKSCIKDFIDVESEQLVRVNAIMDEIFTDLETDYSWTSGGNADYHSVREIVAVAKWSIDERGYVKADGDLPMSTVISNYYYPNSHNHRPNIDFKSYSDFVDEFIQYYNNLDSNNDFDTTVKQLIKMKYVPIKCRTNLSVSNMPMSMLALSKKRQEFNVTLIAKWNIEGYYGIITVHKFVDDANHSLIWFATNTELDHEPGDTFKIKGTPKKHEEYKGIKQTVLNRVVEVKK